jgi:hypothetical protein
MKVNNTLISLQTSSEAIMPCPFDLGSDLAEAVMPSKPPQILGTVCLDMG